MCDAKKLGIGVPITNPIGVHQTLLVYFLVITVGVLTGFYQINNCTKSTLIQTGPCGSCMRISPISLTIVTELPCLCTGHNVSINFEFLLPAELENYDVSGWFMANNPMTDSLNGLLYRNSRIGSEGTIFSEITSGSSRCYYSGTLIKNRFATYELFQLTESPCFWDDNQSQSVDTSIFFAFSNNFISQWTYYNRSSRTVIDTGSGLVVPRWSPRVVPSHDFGCFTQDSLNVLATGISDQQDHAMNQSLFERSVTNCPTSLTILALTFSNMAASYSVMIFAISYYTRLSGKPNQIEMVSSASV